MSAAFNVRQTLSHTLTRVEHDYSCVIVQCFQCHTLARCLLLFMRVSICLFEVYGVHYRIALFGLGVHVYRQIFTQTFRHISKRGISRDVNNKQTHASFWRWTTMTVPIFWINSVMVIGCPFTFSRYMYMVYRPKLCLIKFQWVNTARVLIAKMWISITYVFSWMNVAHLHNYRMIDDTLQFWYLWFSIDFMRHRKGAGGGVGVFCILKWLFYNPTNTSMARNRTVSEMKPNFSIHTQLWCMEQFFSSELHVI